VSVPDGRDLPRVDASGDGKLAALHHPEDREHILGPWVTV
jgi:hypothetical protein